MSCRHRLHLDMTFPQLVAGAAVDSGVKQRREAAVARRESVRELIGAVVGGRRIGPGGSWSERAAETMQACADGVDYIWDAVLPSEPDTGREGVAELLLRDRDRGGYIPVIVVNHKVTDPRSDPTNPDGAATTSDLYVWAPTIDPTRKVRVQPRDQMRLAHLYRMLQRHGLASPGLLGGAIGYGVDCILVHDVAVLLDEYDRRYGDRITVARGETETEPSQIPECRSCPWWPRCSAWLTERHDVSLVAIGSRAEVLRAEGVRTVDDLARWSGPAPEKWQHGVFEDAVLAARAWLVGAPLVRRVEHVTVPRADIEVDVDLESFQEHGAYLWGALLNDIAAGTSEYHPFVTWDPLPTLDEARSFAQFWAWLMRVRAAAIVQGKTFAAYCYSRAAEDKWLLDSARRFVGEPGVPTVEQIRGFIGSPEWVDIYQVVSDQFVCPNGKGLKKIAPVAGFGWRDAEAGGEASMAWYREAVGYEGEPDLTQRVRILEYNEDDVLATRALREWMSGPADVAVPFVDDL
ncbi:TM0106 family RecB-like putative nuclease [Aldersonia sp. NBC_00410]|uniref:TM0106 family RecB-like putative nuclease n=1 Tax=Aldersonia sp. NBC_00410 TaxID=2975954 RepID=UPI002256D98F|nr:TM0106 family RecB-like putative nuclease [Aldersonia sp. NBC_00410]MCX5045105.1 TM0106 family RecB-like putative nuclease [Aldersonia sp. NBC_00410]